MRMNSPACWPRRWATRACAAAGSGGDHGADDVAAAEAAQQREADRDAILIEHDAAGGLEQGRHQTRAVQPGGGVIERGQRRRVAATDRPQAAARRQRHQARPNAAP